VPLRRLQALCQAAGRRVPRREPGARRTAASSPMDPRALRASRAFRAVPSSMRSDGGRQPDPWHAKSLAQMPCIASARDARAQARNNRGLSIIIVHHISVAGANTHRAKKREWIDGIAPPLQAQNQLISGYWVPVNGEAWLIGGHWPMRRISSPTKSILATGPTNASASASRKSSAG
jgi:hypothetical protein